jgi:gonadotropin-releasing hormone receptor
MVFVICWTPYLFISVWFWIDSDSAAQIDKKITNLLFIFAVCPCIVNPIVYGNLKKKTLHT